MILYLTLYYLLAIDTLAIRFILVRYVSQLEMNLISVGALEALSLEVSIRDGVLKMIKGSWLF